MSDSTQIKGVVKEKYAELARAASCCGPGACDCGSGDTSMIGDGYGGIEGYVPEADLGLGCGLPTRHAGITTGQTVLDLGSGAGNDVFIAAREVGPSGSVIGLDMTPDMIELACRNATARDAKNVEFVLGEIENIPLGEASIDVVVSNCVLNLVPDKRAAFSEILRVLKPGAHFCVSDIVTVGQLPAEVRRSAEMYAGCVAGAIERSEYLSTIADFGFVDVVVKEERRIDLPDAQLAPLLSKAEIAAYRASGNGIFSITVVGKKPA